MKLVAFPEALKDANEAIKTDPKFSEYAAGSTIGAAR